MSLSVFKRSRRLILPAIVIMFAFLVEGSMDVWSGVFLRNTLMATALVAGIAFAFFSAALAIGRLTAGRVLFGLGYHRTIIVSGIGAFVGGIVAASTNSPAIAGVAFLVLGFFIASAAPAAFGMVGDSEADPALAVAAMSTVGYTGFVVGPPLMGWLAETRRPAAHDGVHRDLHARRGDHGPPRPDAHAPGEEERVGAATRRG